MTSKVLLSLICSTGKDCHNCSDPCREDEANCTVDFQDWYVSGRCASQAVLNSAS